VSDRRRILVCDAGSQSLHALRGVLRGAGFEVDVTRTAAQALERAALGVPAAAIIELVLPDGDGVWVCRRLREWSAMPVIVLSAVCDEEEQVRTFEAGADDYVTKPFRPRELVARLVANLRRADPVGEEPRVNLDGLEVDFAARAVYRDGERVHLTPTEFKLLRVLTQNRGRLLTHSALLQQVWGAAYVDARQTLRTHIANLRHKIEPAGGVPLIQTDHGVGYRLANLFPERTERGWPAQDVFNLELVRTHVSASREPSPAGWPRRTRRRALDRPYGRAASGSVLRINRDATPASPIPPRISTRKATP
jgi:two-component system KDP operon response regulator KdpE